MTTGVPASGSGNQGHGSSGQGSQLGWAAGQTSLGTAGAQPSAKRELSTDAGVLPELSEAQAVARPMWRHPAFLVSIIATFVVLVVAAVLLIMGALGGGPAKVTDLELTVGDGNAHLTWNANGADVDLFVVSGTEVLDLSQRVRDDGAWIPVAFGLYDDDSCFVVRAASHGAEKVSLKAADLDAQGARSACVADVQQ